MSIRANLNRNALVAPFVVFAVVAIALLGVAGYFYFQDDGSADIIDPIMAKVTRGEFVSQVLDQGEIQSSENVEIRCEARARNGSLSVISVIPEGTSVKAGDFLVELDSTSFEKELEQQNISMANAETAVIQAESNLASAKATKLEYIEGTFKQEVKSILNEIYSAESEIEISKQALANAEAGFAHSRQLLSKGYITNQTFLTSEYELRNAEIKVKQGANSLSLAQEKKRVLEDISYTKETVQLEADIKAANVKLLSEKKSFLIEKEKLAEIEAMIEKCKIKVPEGVEGQVVYAKESSRGGNDWVLEEGTSVRQNQVLVRLPNPEKMEVKALINEQSITQISIGMPATIKVDALNNVTLKGIVTKVNQYAESSGWMSSSIRKYAVYVKILEPTASEGTDPSLEQAAFKALKPGMNSSVTIQVQYEPEVLLAPIQTVYAVQDKQFCLVRKGENQWLTKEIEVGGDNSQMVMIKTGIEEGEDLVMNPGAFKQYMDLPDVELDSNIELPEGAKEAITSATPAKTADAKDAAKGGGKGKGKSKGKSQAGGGGGGGFSADAMISGMMSRYDTNGNGQVDPDELEALSERAKPMITAADSDGDGAITTAELKSSMEKRMKEGGFGGGRRGGGQ